MELWGHPSDWLQRRPSIGFKDVPTMFGHIDTLIDRRMVKKEEFNYGVGTAVSEILIAQLLHHRDKSPL